MPNIALDPYCAGNANSSSFKRYTAALLAIGLAVPAHLLAVPMLGDYFLFGILLLAVMVAAWYGGLGPSALAAILGIIVNALWLRSWTSLAAFVGITVSVILLAEGYRRRLSHAADEIAFRKRAEEQLRSTTANLRRENEGLHKNEERAITDRKSAEQRLQTSEQRMEVAQAAASFVIFDWDLHEQLLLLGDSRSLFGIDTAQLRTYESWLDCVHPEDRALVDREVARAIEEEASLEVEFRVTWPGGGVHWIVARGTITCDQSGKPGNVIGIYQDITRQKAAEEALVQNEKLATAGRLAATIAHEINNPLAALTNLLFILKGDATLSKAGVQYVALAEEELYRVSHLAKQALGFYRETSHSVSVIIPEVLDEVLALYSRNMAGNIRLEKRYGPAVEVPAFRGEIQQVFANLVLNALQALREGGTLTVEASAVGIANGDKGMEVRIRDSGRGISPDCLSRVFEPFFTTKEDVGTGLGLWLAKKIIERHGGTIHVESSTGEHHGTCFSVWLPTAASTKSSSVVAA